MTEILNTKDFEIEKESFRKEIRRGPFKAPWSAILDISNDQLFRDAVWQGFLDACRTFAKYNKNGYQGEENPFDLLAERIQKYFANKSKFDHKSWCEHFIDEMKKVYGYNCRYGQAQKVVNMSFKYLFCCDDSEKYKEKFYPCHMPLDKYTLLWYFSEFNEYYEEWNWMDYDIYDKIQKNIRKTLGDRTLECEFIIWNVYKDKVINLENKNKKKGV